jgi:hypothetical protein
VVGHVRHLYACGMCYQVICFVTAAILGPTTIRCGNFS